MDLLGLSFGVSRKRLVLFVVLGLLSGAAHAGVLILINHSITVLLASEAQSTVVDMLCFAAMLLAFVGFTWWLSSRLIAYTQKVNHRLRLDIARHVIDAEHRYIQNNREQVVHCVTRDTSIIARAFVSMIQITTSAIVIIACLAYLAYLSLDFFLITILTILAGGSFYALMHRRNLRLLETARDRESDFVRHLKHLLYGIQEITIAPEKGHQIYREHIEPASDEQRDSGTRGFVGYLGNNMVGQLLFYGLIGAMILAAPLFSGHVRVVNFVFTMLYLLPPIEAMLVLLPDVHQAEVSAGRILGLRAALQREARPAGDPDARAPSLRTLALDSVCFEHPGSGEETGFRMGPVSLEIQVGETAFICGGNGSGKTTLLKLLLGLLRPSEGCIRVNGEPVTDEAYAGYCKLFATVFGNYYLFDRLYGVADLDTELAGSYLELFEIAHKVKIEDGRFSTINLSAGQRKRLALIAALLEKRPVLLLDEWAADQDPGFRQTFYRHILPTLKQQGFTIIAVTHDDRYYDTADRLYKMEYGRMRELSIADEEAGITRDLGVAL